MMRSLLLLLLLFPRFAPGQVDPVPIERFVQQYAARYRVSPELIAALIDIESGGIHGRSRARERWG
jgi:hypothetical protein